MSSSTVVPAGRERTTPDVQEGSPERIIGVAKRLTAAKVREFAAGPDEASHIWLDVHLGSEATTKWLVVLGKRIWKNARVSAIVHPETLDPEEVTYPALFSGAGDVWMNHAELVDELDLVVAMGWPHTFSEPYLYNIDILEPQKYEFPGDLSPYSDLLDVPAIRAELIVGHLRHETLYGADPALRVRLLTEFLSAAKKVQVSLQPPSKPYKVVDVTLA